ncbi:hypothetical protein [Burkholderia ubonensis]|uniref:hypothetical protein n=1 Tax=Burkholderia ubonensis TaxID=101571 RepID=UPI0012F77B8F|nr:hypothetical protein [Burkholderia ubonensis]
MKAKALGVERSQSKIGRIRSALFSHSDPLRMSDAHPFLVANGPEQVTRLLCASAFLNGKWFSSKVLSFYRERRTAVAPEFGVNIPLLVRACVRAEEWENSFQRQYLFVLASGILSVFLRTYISETTGLIGLSMAWIFSTAIAYQHATQSREIAKNFKRNAFSLPGIARHLSSDLNEDLSASLPQSNQNLIIYHEFNPFVGCGLDCGGWSIATCLNKPREHLTADSISGFAVAEIYETIEKGLSSLNIKNLSIKSYFFVSGADVRDDNEIYPSWPGRPNQVISPASAANYIEGHDSRVRHYKCVQTEEWGGELIISHFIRCAREGEALYIEFKRFLLPPLAEQYRRVDTERDTGSTLRFVVSILVGPIFALVSPVIMLGSGKASDDKLCEEMTKDPTFNFGAETTLRSDFSQNAFGHYFQKYDADFFHKIIERKILDEIVGFLDAHGIDTSDIRDRQTTILNSGILVQGGDVKAEAIAVGEGAKAKKVVGPTT